MDRPDTVNLRAEDTLMDASPTAPILPVIHRNGTSREALLEGACEVGNAIRQALEMLARHAPNQRDYYVDPPRWALVQAQHLRRMKTLQALLHEMHHEA